MYTCVCIRVQVYDVVLNVCVCICIHVCMEYGGVLCVCVCTRTCTNVQVYGGAQGSQMSVSDHLRLELVTGGL